MTLWILHQALTPEEEARLPERTHLRLPFDGLPDLSRVGSKEQARAMLKMLHPDEPPETIARRLDRFWTIYTILSPEDVILVPLPASREAVAAEVTGRYEYRVGDDGSDIHLIPVKWLGRRIPLSKFGKHKDAFSRREPMYEVENKEARIAIYDRLPYKYNRFAKWKWLLAVFFLLGMVRMLMGLAGR